MIRIKKGAASPVIVTLAERQTLPAAFFAFRFQHLATGRVVAFTLAALEDLSVYPERFNEFVLDGSLFPEPGQYRYQIFEGTTQEDAELGILEVENGRALVTVDPAAPPASYSINQVTNVYGG